LLQVTVPLRYYLGARTADDRFAWRMFSTSYVQQYRALDDTRIIVHESVGIDGEVVDRVVDLPSIISENWIRFMKRERLDVIEKFLRWRGHQLGAQTISFQIHRPAINKLREYRKSWLMRFPSGTLEATEEPR